MSSEGVCHIHGVGIIEHRLGQAEAHAQYAVDPGWIWMVNGDTIQVEGLHADVNGHTCLQEVTVGGPMLHGGVVHIAMHEITWYPPSGSKQVNLAGESLKWSIPGIVEVSTRSVDDGEEYLVNAVMGDFGLEVSQWSSDDDDDHCMTMKITKPVDSGDTGLCVSADVADLPVSDADNFADHHSPSPSGDTMDEAVAAVATASLSSNGDKSGTADTLLYFALSLGFANSIVPFVL
jgi:hypothetical protein